MVPLYSFLVACYGLLIRFASLFNPKARKFIQGRENLNSEIKLALQDNSTDLAWFHVASLGEFEQARPVIEAFKAAFSDHKILITFFSPSGYELKKDYPGADYIFYLPLDARKNAVTFLDNVSPSIIVFVKYEFWFHYLNEANRRQIPTYSIAALFTPKHIFFKSYGKLHRKMLGYFNHIFVQNQASLDLLNSIQIRSASVSGDTRYDRVVETLSQPEKYPLVERFAANHQVCVVGSSWPADMHFLLPIINESPSNLRFIIAPHEVHESGISHLEKSLKKSFVRVTDGRDNFDEFDVLIINTIGMLSSVYQYGHFAYIGGAFGDGLHNILEAVTFGLPVIFGNKGLDKFPESLELAKLGGAFPFRDRKQLEEIFQKLVNDESFRTQSANICKGFIEQRTGATERILTYWKENYEGTRN